MSFLDDLNPWSSTSSENQTRDNQRAKQSWTQAGGDPNKFTAGQYGSNQTFYKNPKGGDPLTYDPSKWDPGANGGTGGPFDPKGPLAAGASAIGRFDTASGRDQGLFGPGGSLAGPGAGEKYFSDMLTGDNAYFNRMKTEGLRSMDDAAAAGGGFNSGARLAAEGNFMGDLVSKESDKMFQRAGEAQQLEQGRGAMGLASAMGLGQATSKLDFDSKMASIEVQLQKMGYDQAQTQSWLNFFASLFGTAGQIGAAAAR